jgi:phage terminase large subunit GpA-like protein
MSQQADLSRILAYFRPAPMRMEHLEVIGRRHKPNLADWMEENYCLAKTSSRISGPWQRGISPFWGPVLEWLGDAVTRVIWVIAATQTGKSTVLGGFLGYCIDVDPGPTKFVVPDEKVAKKRIKRLRPAFKASRNILRHFKNDINRFLIGEPTELDNMILTLGWPTAPATLADDPCRYVIGDEVCEWREELDEDMDPISKLESRVRTFESVSKTIYVTSPKMVGDLTWRNVQRCQQWRIWTRCPHCGGYHVARNRHILLDKTPAGTYFEGKVYKRGGKARYVCPLCQRGWSEYERWDAVTHHVVCPEGLEVLPGGQINGPVESSPYKAIQVPSVLVHPMFTTVDMLAATFADAWEAKCQGNIGPYMRYRCNEEAEFWEQRQRQTDREQVERHKDPSYRMGQVPRRVQMVTVGLDVQADHIWMVVMGYGYRYERWLIDAGRIETGSTARVENWQIVEDMLKSEWRSAVDDKVVYRATRAAIDSRYQRAERDEESTVVYTFCLRFEEGMVIPILGAGRDKMKDASYRVSKPLAGSDLKRYLLNVDAYKDRMWNGLHDPERSPGPGYLHLPGDVPSEVVEQLASEQQTIENGLAVWRLKQRGGRNHLLDGTVYADFAAEIAGVFTLRDVDHLAGLRTALERQKIRGMAVKSAKAGGFLEGLPVL